ncbi:MFS transporter [Pigmentiphaga soli]|uniref:MFS transporter n=1 Tax=Pigmentiphaga soli TaxID=1007095 RepID=A0ABP8GQA3_9BURK
MPLALGPLVIPLVIACALFMEAMDSTVLVTALPAMARDLGHDPVSLKLAVTSYVMSLGMFIPVCGWVADRFGPRTVFRTAIGIFVAGALLSASSTSLAMLVVARFIQGVGGAMMVPVGRIIIFRSVPKTEFVRAMIYLTVPAQLGPIVGPILGGFMTTYLHWRLIFLVSVPTGALAIYLAGRYIEDRREPHPGRLDWPGFALSALGGGAAMLGLSLIDGTLIAPSTAAWMAAAGGLLLLVYVFYARHVERPLLDLRFFQIPTFNASVAGGALFRVGLGALPFLLPLMLQEGLGMTAFASGSITCATAFGALFMRSMALRILHRLGFRRVLIYNAVLSALAIAACGLFMPGTPHWLIWTVVLLGGFFPSMQFTSLNALAYADLDSRDVGRATSLASVVQQVSLGMGVTVSGVALNLTRDLHGREAFLWTDFWPAFLLMGLLIVASIPITARLPHNAGDEITRQKSKA